LTVHERKHLIRNARKSDPTTLSVQNMFQDIVHFQNLFSSGWPATTITDNGAADGNQVSIMASIATRAETITGR
jgi:hypothetical protein